MRWEFHSAKEFARFSRVWDEINQAASGLPALDSTFVALLLKEFGTGRELLAVGYRGNIAHVVTVLRRKYGSFWETFQPAQAPLGAWIQRPAETAESLVPGLLHALPGFTLAVATTQQDPDLVRRPDDCQTTIAIDYVQTSRVTISGTFDDYWAARGKNLRNNLKKQRSRLEKDGVPLRFDIVTDPADVAQAIDDYSRLESSGWKAAAGTAIHPGNAQGRFYRALLEEFCRRGAGRICRLRYGDAVVAVDLCIESQDVLIVLKTTYDETIRDSSPASLLRQEYFRQIFDDARIKRIEFYGKLMDWHTKWTDEVRTLYHVNYYRWAALSRGYRILKRLPMESTAAAINLDWRFFPIREFRTYQDKWEELNLAGHFSPLLSPSFLIPLIDEFADGSELLAVCGSTSSPGAMTLLRKTGPGKWETYQPSQAPVGLLVKRTSVPLAGLLRSLLASLPGMPLVVGISHQDPDLLPRPADGGKITTLDSIETARVLIDRPFEEYWNARDGELRANIRRRLNRLHSMEIEPRLEVITDPAAISEAIDHFGRLESAGWKGREGTAISGDNQQGHFYKALLRLFCERGLGRIYRYWFGDQIAAMQLCIEGTRTLIFLKTTYDENFKVHAPGILMQRAIMEQVFAEAKFDRVEFYGKTGEPQAKWCDNQIRTMYHVNCYRWPLLLKVHRRLGGRLAESSDSAAPGSPSAAPASKEVAYKWQLVPVSEFGRHMRAWDSVLSKRSTPLKEAAFINTLLSIFGRGNEVLAICGEPRAPYAMAILRHRQAGVWETFQQSQGPLSAWVHRRDLSFEDILPSLFNALPGMPFVVSVTQKDPSIHARPQESARLKVIDYVPTSRVLVNRSFEDYWQTRDKKVRYEIGRRLRRLSELGVKPRLEVIRDRGDVAAAIEMYGNLEASGWKGKAGTAVRGDNEQGIFYRAILEDFCARGKGRIYRYSFDDQVVAMQLCIEDANTLVLLKTAYDENYRRYSPGILMKHALFEQVFREGTLKKIEFYGAIIEWQGKWIDEVRTMYQLNYYRWPWLTRIQQIRNTLRQQLGSVAQTPGRAQFDDDDVNGTLRDATLGRTYACTVFDNLPALPDRYKPLFSRAGRSSVYFTLPWYLNFIQTILAPNERLRIYAVDTAMTPPAARAVLPMYYRDSGTGCFGARTLSGLSNYYTSLFGPVLDPDEPEAQKLLETLAAAIAGDEIRWDVIDMHPLASDTHVFPNLISAFRNAGLLVQTYFCFGNRYLQVRGRSYAEYYAALPSQLRNTIKRKKEQLEKSSRSKIVVYRDEASLQEGLRAYEQIYAASWKTQEPYPEFIRGLCRNCAEVGWLRLGVVYVDDQPAASQIWIVSGGIASIYKLAYDERYAKLSLGTILTAHLMEHVIDVDKVQEVDYLTGDDAYKKDWMSDRRERWGIVAFNLRTPHGLLAASRHLLGRAIKRALDAVRHRGGTRT